MATVSFRCTEAQKIELEERAQGDISGYVRQKLFRQMEQENTLELILQRLDEQAENAGGTQASGMDRQSTSMLIELLLLLRTASKPDAKREAQAEVERLGFQVWESSKRDH